MLCKTVQMEHIIIKLLKKETEEFKLIPLVGKKHGPIITFNRKYIF